MGFSVRWNWLATLLCLLCMGGEVWCDCTITNRMQIEGGSYTLTKQLQTGSLMIYHCDEGYHPYPDSFRLCQLNGSWKPAPRRSQRCRLVECPDPNVLEYGTVTPLQEKYFVHNLTTYECYSGYSMRGSDKRTCLPNGKWSGPTPICSRDTDDVCADPGIPAGAARIGNIFDVDDKVKYSCNGNLIMVGSSERVCQENGQWTGIEPACYYKYTYDSPLEVAEAFGSSIRNSLTTLQPTDDTQEGRIIRITKNGTLNIYIAVDVSESIEKDEFENARNAVLQLIRKIASFSVTPNYDIIFFSSEVQEVVNILDAFGGNVQQESSVTKLKDFQIGDRNAGTDLNLAFTTFLERMAIIKQRVGDEAFKEHRHVILMFTDGAYNMGGSPRYTVKNIKDMVYMNQAEGTNAQSREEYLDIYVFAIGNDIFDDDLIPLTTGSGGKHYFRLSDTKDLVKTFDEIIDESEVKGLCGLHKEYETENQRNRFPWWASIHIQTDSGPTKCLGSLVSPQFILTAAHCFPFGVTPEAITVEIGHSIVKGVRTLTLHPNYNVNGKADEGVKEFYDYDVALIQLKADVDISISVRPICIPCTQETSDALQLAGKSTCKQQEQLLLKNQKERLSFLTKQGNTVHEKSMHVKLGDNRDSCIRHALEADGITTTDPKVPVTDNFLCSGGVFPDRDHIACKGDSGGAVFKNYEHRTVQVALVSWGTKEKCTSGGVVESDESSRDFHINLFKVVPFLKSVLGQDQDYFTPLQFLED
ncbi:complement factor B-like isoform X2 [Xyrichtys novacula]|uniref:C3/C5 convertase n=1 Tax=Xyrichtys novacula TaxID=13765 RepID=A0AAV1FU74_XYRNO|nr:complement factor B-like isoform X2 [Xyrichtys novacula]